MKILSFLMATALASSTAMASPNVFIGSDDILTGGVASIPLIFQADGTVSGLDFTFSFDPSKFSIITNCAASVPTTGADASVSCAVVGNTVKVLVAAPFSYPVPVVEAGNQPLGSISFDANLGTESGVYNLVITEENYFDASANAVNPTNSTNGQIVINTPIQDGDANGDGFVNEADIAVVIDQYFGRSTGAGKPDCNTDGSVNSGDVICITNVALQ